MWELAFELQERPTIVHKYVQASTFKTLVLIRLFKVPINDIRIEYFVDSEK